jgi:hypothetical protein
MTDLPPRPPRWLVTGWWVLVGAVVLGVVGADVVLLPGHAIGAYIAIGGALP